MLDWRERKEVLNHLNNFNGEQFKILSTLQDVRDERINQLVRPSEAVTSIDKLELSDEEALDVLEATICHSLHKCANAYEWLRNFKESKRRK